MRYFGCVSISFLFIFLIVNLKSAHADRLECKFDKYANSGYRDSIAKSWIPPIQTHEIQGQNIIHNLVWLILVYAHVCILQCMQCLQITYVHLKFEF